LLMIMPIWGTGQTRCGYSLTEETQVKSLDLAISTDVLSPKLSY
jgi:hypothetical protein